MTLHIHADRERCMGSGQCAYLAPNTFDIDDEVRVILLGGQDPDDLVRAAVEACPQRALSISEEGPSDVAE